MMQFGILILELQDMSFPIKIGLLIISYYQRDKPYLLKMIVNVKLRGLALFQYCSTMEFSKKLPMFSMYQG